MTEKQIIEWAREVGFTYLESLDEKLHMLAGKIAAHAKADERERCAQAVWLCDNGTEAAEVIRALKD